jgi:hypothetical protein
MKRTRLGVLGHRIRSHFSSFFLAMTGIKAESQHPSEESYLARKRRTDLRAMQTSFEDEDGNEDSTSLSKRRRIAGDEDDNTVDTADFDGTGNSQPSLRGIKKQARYVPGVPMTREELAAWRKEARRVRNRESAAASRTKTRTRIEELQAEVDTLKAHYDAALERIAELESSCGRITSTDNKPCQDIMTTVPLSVAVSPTPSIAGSPGMESAVSPLWSPSSDDDSFELPPGTFHSQGTTHSQGTATSLSFQHSSFFIDNIIRPTAV